MTVRHHTSISKAPSPGGTISTPPHQQASNTIQTICDFHQVQPVKDWNCDTSKGHRPEAPLEENQKSHLVLEGLELEVAAEGDEWNRHRQEHQKVENLRHNYSIKLSLNPYCKSHHSSPAGLEKGFFRVYFCVITTSNISVILILPDV